MWFFDDQKKKKKKKKKVEKKKKKAERKLKPSDNYHNYCLVERLATFLGSRPENTVYSYGL